MQLQCRCSRLVACNCSTGSSHCRRSQGAQRSNKAPPHATACIAGTLQFAKFETGRMGEVLSFIESHGLLRYGIGSGSVGSPVPISSGSNGSGSGSNGPVSPPDSSSSRRGDSGTCNGPVPEADGSGSRQNGKTSAARIPATGGGAFKSASQFQVREHVCIVTFDKGKDRFRGADLLWSRLEWCCTTSS